MGSINYNSRNVGKPGIITNIFPHIYNAFGSKIKPWAKISLVSSEALSVGEELNGTSFEVINDTNMQEKILNLFFSLEPSSQNNFDLSFFRESVTDNSYGVIDFHLDFMSEFDEQSGFVNIYQEGLDGSINAADMREKLPNFRVGNLAPYNALSILNHNANDFYADGSDFSIGFQLLVEGAYVPSGNPGESTVEAAKTFFINDSSKTSEYDSSDGEIVTDYTHLFNANNIANPYSTIESEMIVPLTYINNDGTVRDGIYYGGSTISSWAYNNNIANNNYAYADGVHLNNVTKIILRVLISPGALSNIKEKTDLKLKIGSVGLGSYLPFPTSPNLDYTKEVLSDGVTTKDSISGSTLYDIKYTQPNFVIDYGDQNEGYHKDRFSQRKLIDKKGRRVYDLEIEGILDSELYPVLEAPNLGADGYWNDIEGNNVLQYSEFSTLQSNYKSDNDNNKRTLYSTLVHETLNGKLPFIFCENLLDTNEWGCVRQDKFMYALTDGKSITFDSISTDYYSLTLSIREVW